MPFYLLHHHHEARQCSVAFAAFNGHESPLRHRSMLASCAFGDHSMWWTVEAASESDALALLPAYVGRRSTATRVSTVDTP